MRISCFVVFEAILLSIVIAKTEDQSRVEEITTTKEPITTYNVSSFQEQKTQQRKQKQLQDPDKPRNVRATKRISSSPFFPENLWTNHETFSKTPIFFEQSLQDKEKSKLVILEPFFRVKKVEKGFWGWLKKIFSDNKDKKSQGQGPLIGPIKIPGMGENVYIRGIEPLENEAERVIIHVVTRDHPLGSSDKGIKFASPVTFDSSFGSFETVHKLPIETSNSQIIVSPHFSNREVKELFDTSHFSVLDPSWSSFSSHPVTFPPGKEDIFSNPSFFRKHSTESEGSEFSGSLSKDAESSQQYTAWAQPHEYDSSTEKYENIQKIQGQQGSLASEGNQQFSSSREDIDKVQGVKISQLEISKDSESLPLYPPLFESSLSQSESNDEDKGSENSDSSSGSTRHSAHHSGLGAYQTQSQITSGSKTNTNDEELEEKYNPSDGIRQVEAPNLYQAENKGMYQFSEGDVGKIENSEEAESATSNVENSKKIRNNKFRNYGSKDSGNIADLENSNSNETTEVLKKIFGSHSYNYRVSNGRFVIPETEEDEKKESIESSTSTPKVQSQSESRKASLQRHRSRFSLDEGSRNVRNEVRSRNRVKPKVQNSETKTSDDHNTGNQKSDLQTDTSKGISKTDLHEYKNDTMVLSTGEKEEEEDSKCAEKEETEENEESSREETNNTMTTEEVKQFFVEESKRFEDILEKVEEETEAIKEESKTVEEELKAVKEKSKPVQDEIIVNKKSKTVERKKSSDIQNVSTEPTKQKIQKVTLENRLNNKTRFNMKLKTSNKGEVKKSNSTGRMEFRKPLFQAPRVSIMEGRFKSKLKNNATSGKLNSTFEIENSKTTPPTHISKIFSKNRSNDKLQNYVKKDHKSGTEEEKKSEEEPKKSPDKMLEIEKLKEELHMRMSKLFPKARNNNSKINTEVTTVKDENEKNGNQKT